jgi:hypothetical protein
MMKMVKNNILSIQKYPKQDTGERISIGKVIIGWDPPLEHKPIGDIYELNTLGMTFLCIGVRHRKKMQLCMNDMCMRAMYA